MTMAVAQDKPLIISFNGPAGEAYIGKFIKGLKATAVTRLNELQTSEAAAAVANPVSEE